MLPVTTKAAEHCSAAWRIVSIPRKSEVADDAAPIRGKRQRRYFALLLFFFFFFVAMTLFLGVGVKLRQGWFKSRV
jgi:hypothetical protein